MKFKISSLEENKNIENLCDFGLGKEFLDITPKAQFKKYE